MNLILFSASIVLLLIGAVLTFTGFKKDDWKDEPKILIDHKNQLKIIGPIVIGLSLVVIAAHLITLFYSPSSHKIGSPQHSFSSDHDDSRSDFGFKFY